MNEKPAGLRIGKKAFIQSAVILLALMITAGILTVVIPAGSYQTATLDGRSVIIPDSFRRYTGEGRSAALSGLALVHRTGRGAVGAGRPDDYHDHSLYLCLSAGPLL